jgi:hypothetical protein
VILAYGLESGHMASLAMTVAGVMSFLLGPAVLIELIAGRGKVGWRD